MKKTWIGVSIAVWCLLGVFSFPMAQETPLDMEAQRQRIAQDRQHHDAVFLQTERLCYRRFAVSDCLHRARAERQVAFDELRRQEIVLNDIDRKAKAAAAIKRIESNVSEQAASTGSAEQ